MNCLTRSIAHLLGKPLDQVPDFTPLVGSTRAFWAHVDDWLQARGLACVWIEDPCQASAMRGSYIVLMRDAAAGWHAVVYRDGRLDFDPSAPRPGAVVAGVLLVYPLSMKLHAERNVPAADAAPSPALPVSCCPCSSRSPTRRTPAPHRRAPDSGAPCSSRWASSR